MLAMAMPSHNDFTASNGWLQAWTKRHSVKWAALCQVGGTVSSGWHSVKWAAQCQVGGTVSSGRHSVKWAALCQVGGTVSSGRHSVKWAALCQVGGTVSSGRHCVQWAALCQVGGTVSSGQHCVKWAALCGEAAAVPEDVVTEWTLRLPVLTVGYRPADIYTADEIRLYYNALPQRSMVVRGDPHTSIKTSKERVTVLLACSVTGEKLKPLLIGKSAKPQCFMGIDKAALPVTYRANSKAWITGVFFKEWLDKLNEAAGTECPAVH